MNSADTKRLHNLRSYNKKWSDTELAELAESFINGNISSFREDVRTMNARSGVRLLAALVEAGASIDEAAKALNFD